MTVYERSWFTIVHKSSQTFTEILKYPDYGFFTKNTNLQGNSGKILLLSFNLIPFFQVAYYYFMVAALS